MEINLCFDPMESDGLLPEIFPNPTAEMIWCLWKRSHIVNQYFNQEVLDLAGYIDEKDATTANEWAEAMRYFPGKQGMGSNFLTGDVDGFIKKNWIVLSGTEKLKTVIKKEK